MITSVSLRLLLRHWQSVSDLPQMMTVANTSRTADGLKGVTNLETMHGIYVKSSGFDPAVDVVIAEVDGQMVGFARGWWLQEVGGAFLYRHVGFVAPHWRRHGIGSAMLAWLERRQTEVASKRETRISTRARRARGRVGACGEGAQLGAKRNCFGPKACPPC